MELTNIRIPFWNLVGFLVKLSFASVPALIIVCLAWWIAWAFLGALFVGSLHH